jgi:CheY-like chemotaxis protein
MSSEEKILIVEDSEENILFISQILEDNGYSYVVARNGNEALAAMEESRPVLVLLDIMMPRKSGAVVLNRMKKTPELQDVPVIVVTGTGQVTGVNMSTGEEQEKEEGSEDHFQRAFGQELREKIFNLEPDDFVEKPIDPQVLADKIKNLIS